MLVLAGKKKIVSEAVPENSKMIWNSDSKHWGGCKLKKGGGGDLQPAQHFGQKECFPGPGRSGEGRMKSYLLPFPPPPLCIIPPPDPFLERICICSPCPEAPELYLY